MVNLEHVSDVELRECAVMQETRGWGRVTKGGGERERERGRQADRQTDTERQTERETHRDRDSDRDRDTETDTQTDRQRKERRREKKKKKKKKSCRSPMRDRLHPIGYRYKDTPSLPAEHPICRPLVPPHRQQTAAAIVCQ